MNELFFAVNHFLHIIVMIYDMEYIMVSSFCTYIPVPV